MKNINQSDTISRSAAITLFEKYGAEEDAITLLNSLPPARQTVLTAEDIETIRIHLSAFKETLCNQGRWAEAAEYERLIQRLTGKGGQE